VDPVPDPLLLRNPGSAGNRTRASGSVARNTDHLTTEAVSVQPKFNKVRYYVQMLWRVEQIIISEGCSLQYETKKLIDFYVAYWFI
jgi:hypothetical protein